MQYSLVIYTPSTNRDASNQLAETLGYGRGCFSVPLYDNGTIEAYGLHTAADQDFIDMLTAAQSGTLPVIEGMTQEQVAQIVSQWSVSVQPIEVDAGEHFDIAITPLTREVPDEAASA